MEIVDRPITLHEVMNTMSPPQAGVLEQLGSVMMPGETITDQETHKSAAHISMMRLETIMITDIRYSFVDNISGRNEVLSISVSPSLHLSASVWTADVIDSVVEAQLDCLDYVLRKLATALPDCDFWLVAGHKTLQQDNRITRHNGFWKSLKRAGVPIPERRLIGESMRVCDGGVRFFGAIRCDLGDIRAAHAVLNFAQGAVVFVPKTRAEAIMALLVQRGWPTINSKPPEEIIESVCPESGLVVDFYGEFDDSEVSIAAIGRRELL